MPRKKRETCIQLRGVRHNNLKNFDLDLPLGKLIVITGLSGSGKSSLAFDTLYAEGQRRYIETFTPYARQFFDRMDKPRVDRIEGIPPAIAIQQRNTVKTTRSTIGTMTEICDHVKSLWAQKADLYCSGCGKTVMEEDIQSIWKYWIESALDETVLISFDVPLSLKLSLKESINLVKQQGFSRIFLKDEPMRLEESLPQLEKGKETKLTIIQDRIKLTPRMRSRFTEACEQAYHFGKGHLTVRPFNGTCQPASGTRQHSRHRHCSACQLEYKLPTPSLFSFNNPAGACPKCKGFGRVISIDYKLVIPDKNRTLKQGAVKPWQTGQGMECQRDMISFCTQRKIPTDIPFKKLKKSQQNWVIEGDPGYGSDENHQWPKAWYGVRGYFRWLESKSYKMHVRVLLARYRSYTICPSCEGTRFQPEALNYRMYLQGSSSDSLTLPEFYKLPLSKSLEIVESWQKQFKPKVNEPMGLILNELQSRLKFMVEVGLSYLTLDRPTRSLSGGETERVNLTSCLGTRLVNTLYVLDEPSVGLHPKDTQKLITTLKHLRDQQNTVVVVEHEAQMMLAADQIIDIGPGHGTEGGNVVFQGSAKQLMNSKRSLTGQYLSTVKTIDAFRGRPVQPKHKTQWMQIKNASKHNLKNIAVNIPLNRLVCISGVSGSGKTTLVRDVLIPMLRDRLNNDLTSEKTYDGDASSEQTMDGIPKARVSIQGHQSIDEAVLVDQSPIGRTPRSNPAVYVGAFDAIRELFAKTPTAREKGYKAGHFSFNSRTGQCQHCRGVGFEKIEMQFLSDVFIQCEECEGRRFKPQILKIKLMEPGSAQLKDAPRAGAKECRSWSIADMLKATVDEAMEFLQSITDSSHAIKACRGLQWLQQAGLGYLQLGQPVNTLSGGESQRLKLVKHLTQISNQRKGPKH
ncbi:MAG TPA: excinuclease ABC subunit A, partial [Verrucomicrobiales bacterium]|nr:excinuclease ABC subunit A [Verrucomicrobiales bacterium]